ncbi:energy transducer TonB [Sandarakinorhabdus sp. AAP62]|uniref:energy transducer TonB n=1 Tax=Sandarakinorhabdus sp. AAP62 TaxID=1248916 RepID=UPI00031E821D|nr:energy transducer TonB [Sandarakinorhabdus sp. AAP62]
MRRLPLILAPMLLAASPPQPRKIAIPVEDYPEAAASVGAEGDVGLDLAIDAKGVVTGCTVTAGADLPAGLAGDSCRIVQKNWRFTPALDDAGKKTIGRASFTIAWRIIRRCPPTSPTTVCVFL